MSQTRRPIARFTRSLAILALAGACLLPAATASAQVAMSVSGLGGGAGGGGSITKTSFQRYSDLLKLDADQKEAASALFEAYQTSSREQQQKLQDEMKSLQSEIREDDVAASFQRIPALIEKHGEASGKLTNQFLADLKSILTTAQAEQAWPRLERYRRRAAWLRMGPISGSAVDLTEVVAKLKLPAELTSKLQGPLDQYEVDIDRALVEREQFEKGDAAKPKAHGAVMFDPEAMDKRVKFDRENAVKVRDINRTYQRQLGALLPDRERARLDEQFQAASFKSIYRPTHTAKSLQAAEKFEDLSAEQRERLKAIQETYAREIKAANDRWAAAQERAEAEGKAHAFPVLHVEGNVDDFTPADLKEARTARRDLEKQTAEQLAQVLTEDQRGRLPKRATTARSGSWGGSGGVRTGMRVMAHDDGQGNSAVMVVATEDDGPMIIDDESEEETEEGDAVIRHVIIHRDEQTTTPATPAEPPPGETPPSQSPAPPK